MNITKSNNITTYEKNQVVKFTKMCLREIAKKEHEINLSYDELCAGINVNIKNRSQRSYGGKEGITIDVGILHEGSRRRIWAEQEGNKEGICFVEYKAYAKDPVIGNAYTTPQVYLLTTVAHEVAHHIQYRCGPHTRWLRNIYRKPHGEGFQAIYRILRSRVVNPLIEAEKFSVGMSRMLLLQDVA